MSSAAVASPALRLRRILPTAGKSVLATFEGWPLQEQAALLTLPLLLLYVDDFWYVNIPVVSLVIAGLVLPALRLSSFFWFVLSCFLTAGVLYNWYVVDNHKYLLGYWCVAILCSFWARDSEASLKISARWLMVLAFGLAVFWKLVSPDFLNGSFFQYALVFDPRFSARFETLGLLQHDALELNRAAFRALMSYDSHLTNVSLTMEPGIQILSRVMAWWTLLTESAIAVTFLLPGRRWIPTLRNVFLITFISTTYLLAPVLGFGWLLVILGFVQCDRSQRVFRTVYLLLIPILQLFRIPWFST